MNVIRRNLHHWTVADRVFIFVVALLALPSLLGAFAPPPLEYRNLPFPVVSPVVKAGGDSLILTVERCNRTNEVLPYTIARILVDEKRGNRTQLTDASSFMGPGCETIESKITGIPMDTPAGVYHLEAVSVARVGSRVWNVPWSTRSFVVEAR